MTDKKKIMLVDDEPDITFGLRIGLEDNGFKVDAFNDPRLALSNFRPGSYDILLLDIRMPKMDGFELCQEIKKIDNKVKVCFMTAFDELYLEQFKKRFPMMDAGCFIRKPISIYDLAAEVNAKLTSAATKKAESVMLNNNRILLVDNEEDIAFGFKIGLEDNGFKVDAFNDPRLALSNFKPGSYDILLLDIRMPKMDCFEFYVKMREIDDKVKVYFITGF